MRTARQIAADIRRANGIPDTAIYCSTMATCFRDACEEIAELEKAVHAERIRYEKLRSEGLVCCDVCGDLSNAKQGSTCGRVDFVGQVPCEGTYQEQNEDAHCPHGVEYRSPCDRCNYEQGNA